ncbi:MAG: M12 family metallo-peptidase [Pseudomonadota bacterium]
MTLARVLIFVVLASLASANVRAQKPDVAAFQVIEMPTGPKSLPGQLRIRAFGQTFHLRLAPNADLLGSLPAAQRAKVSRQDLFLEGTLAGVAGSWVRLNRIAGKFSGGFFDGNELYLIDRAGSLPAALAAGAQADQTVLFRFADLDFGDLIDEGGITPGIKSGPIRTTVDYQTFVGHLRAIAVAKGSPLLALPVTIVSDVQFTTIHGSNTTSVVAGRVNFVDGIYSSQLGTGIELLHHQILTNNDVLVATDASDLLGGEFDNSNNLVQPGFRQFMVSGAGSGIPFEGLAHLFTGRGLDGSTVGVAYVGVLCNRGFGYGVNENRSSDTRSALVFAHELGHNFGAPHDGERACSDEQFSGIMNASLNGSEQFSNCSLDQMSQRVARASCLVDDGRFIFSDDFESDG